MCDIIRYHIVAITDRRSNCPFRTAFYRTWMRPGLSVHHPLHTGAFRCTSIPGNDRRTNGVCLYRNLPYAACIRMDRKYDQPSLIPGISAFHLGSYVRNARKNLKADSKKTAVAATFHGSHGCFSITILFPKYALRYLPASSPVPDSPLPAQQVPAYSPLPDMPVLPHSERASYHPTQTPSVRTPEAHD